MTQKRAESTRQFVGRSAQAEQCRKGLGTEGAKSVSPKGVMGMTGTEAPILAVSSDRYASVISIKPTVEFRHPKVSRPGSDLIKSGKFPEHAPAL